MKVVLAKADADADADGNGDDGKFINHYNCRK